MTKSYVQLVPSVERRLATWISLETKRRSEAPMPRPSITISRRVGSEAFPLAEQLKELLDNATGETWNIYDKVLLERVAHDEGLSMNLLENLGGPASAGDSIGFLFPRHVSHDAAFRRLARHLVQIAEAGSAIIVGRGGAILTQKLANCYHFRLDAAFELRVASLARRMDISEREAEKLTREMDRTQEKFIEECVGASLSDLAPYDAIFNTGRQNVRAVAQAILAYVAERWPDKKYFKSARLAAAL
jgi:cytidylate kinase